MHALLLLLLLDVTRPAYLGLTEVGEGRFDVVWRVPRRGDRVLAIRARLPDAFREVAPPTVALESGVQITRWTVEAKPWELPGAVIRVEGPGAARVDTMVRFEFRDGTTVARILPPGTPECRFPHRASARSLAREIQGSVLAGLRHLVSLPHLVFVLGLALSGHGVVALVFFFLGQLVPVSAPEPFAHALLCVAAAIAALQPERKQLYAIAALCGLAHGSPPAVAIGMDAGALVLVFAGSMLPRFARYAVGPAAIALALIEAASAGPVEAEPAAESILVAPAAKQAPGSAPVAATTDAPLQVFLEVTPFETRVEWVAQVAALGVAQGKEIALTEQEATKQRIRGLFERRLTLLLDGGPAAAAEVRVDFVTREAGGVLERVQPVVESMDTALVGVAHSFPTRAPPGKVVVRWTGAKGIPAVVVDPKNTRTATLDTELVWADKLAMPPVRAVAVSSRVFDLSLISVALLLSAAFFRRLWFLRLVLAGACLTAPYLQVAIPLPGKPEPNAEVIEALLANIYRSLEVQDENTAYDRLKVSVTDEALATIYLEQRRMLELGKRGGARARVDSVEVTKAEGNRIGWDAGGFVVHFGHRHFRQSAYEARVDLVPADGTWKIARLEVLDKQRTR